MLNYKYFKNYGFAGIILYSIMNLRSLYIGVTHFFVSNPHFSRVLHRKLYSQIRFWKPPLSIIYFISVKFNVSGLSCAISFAKISKDDLFVTINRYFHVPKNLDSRIKSTPCGVISLITNKCGCNSLK
ncbi:unnamed protein product [Moneuplotes crassus]|uniref:Uncharacterized protein n=1 Tax=Euplotes crassus TaxID=5936 RepID=A0AAD2D651_EUPCR|nr:unnamed protein product [Moneuplotes crassus]